MRNQRGEVVTAIMVVMMGVMMIFSGMHMLQVEHRSEENHTQAEHRHNHSESMQHMHDNVEGQADVPVRVEDQ